MVRPPGDGEDVYFPWDVAGVHASSRSSSVATATIPPPEAVKIKTTGTAGQAQCTTGMRAFVPLEVPDVARADALPVQNSNLTTTYFSSESSIVVPRFR